MIDFSKCKVFNKSYAIKSIYEKLNINSILNFIDNIEEIDNLQKTFYKTMLEKRYDLILTPAYDRANQLLKDISVENECIDNEYER